MRSLNEYRSKISELVSEKKILNDKRAELELKLEELRAEMEAAIRARIILTEVAKLTQMQVKEYIESLVSMALQSVFQDRNYKFIAEFSIKKNKADVSLMVKRGNREPYYPEDEQAGSVVDVISFALRVVLWALQTKRSRNVLILDEPFRFTGNLIGVAGQMMKEVSSKLGLQIIIVTHSQELIAFADRAWEVFRIKSGSKVLELERSPTPHAPLATSRRVQGGEISGGES